MGRTKRVVIVGAGFGGLATAKALAGTDVEVTLVDRSNHHLFQPLLYQVATATLSPADIASAARALVQGPNVQVIMDEVIGVDTTHKLVMTRSRKNLPYDYLVLATGADYSFFGNDEWARHAPTLKTLEDALTIREGLLASLERAERNVSPSEVEALLTFVVVGGGPTGVEMAGAIAELARSALAKDFRNLDPMMVKILLIEAGPAILSSFPKHLSNYAVKALEKLGVEVRLSSPVTTIDQSGINLGEMRISSRNVIWCAGTQARPAAMWVGASADRNLGVRVAKNCSVIGQPDIFAIGDVSSFDSGKGMRLPGLAPVAKQQGRFVGKLLLNRANGRREPEEFVYKNWGSMAVIGRSHAVADFGKLRFKGFVGWLAWSLVHLMLLIDFRSRASVYLHWSWAWFTRGRAARLLTGVKRESNSSTPSTENIDS